ncbi:MAG: hypothetical protein ACRDT4_08615, partial [Micromonosporaceae bacterium]
MRRWLGLLGGAVTGLGRRVAALPTSVAAVFRRTGNDAGAAWRGAGDAMKRPGARLGLHGLALVGVLGAAVLTGLYVVPSVAGTRPASAPSTSAAPQPAPVDAPGGDAPQAQVPSAPPSGSPTNLKRPQDALAA